VSLDIRVPIGLLFTVLGVMLAGYGIMSDPSIYRRSLGHNVNLFWGLVLLAFGALMLVFGRRGTSGVRSAASTVEGQAIERMEHQRGVERDVRG
jgi:hypothetical protein